MCNPRRAKCGAASILESKALHWMKINSHKIIESKALHEFSFHDLSLFCLVGSGWKCRMDTYNPFHPLVGRSSDFWTKNAALIPTNHSNSQPHDIIENCLLRKGFHFSVGESSEEAVDWALVPNLRKLYSMSVKEGFVLNTSIFPLLSWRILWRSGWLRVGSKSS